MMAVRQILVKRHCGVDALCPLCHLEDESLNHAMFDCSLVKNVWNASGVTFDWGQLDPLPFKDRVRLFLLNSDGNDLCTVLATMWAIWSIRNTAVFEEPCGKPLEVRRGYEVMVRDYIRYRSELSCPGNAGVHRSRAAWATPELGWIKINVDAAILGDGTIGLGMVARNDSGAVIDPVKCSKLSMEKRKEIVYELAKWSQGAEEVLQSWSRVDILQVLCAEMGKERKYTGLTKLKMIELLLKVVSEKTSGVHQSVVCEQQSSLSDSQKSLKRPRKSENVSRLIESASATNISTLDADTDSTYCKNAACKARMNNEDVFCKRCTCCVCHKYDDNKDPSLWLTCSSEPPFPGDSCNMSCHLECAIKHARSGIARNRLGARLDGDFYCISCGKVNDLMRRWRKQLMVAMETRRVDILCYRISLSQKLLSRTQKYQKLSKIVNDAIKLLEAEVGTLSGGPATMGRGIVNRLSSGQEVQRLCASALELFDLIAYDTTLHQDSRTTLPNLSSSNDITNMSSLSNPASVEDETTNITTCCDLNETKTEDYFEYCKTRDKIVVPNSSNEPVNSTNVSQEPTPSGGSDEEHATGKPVSENGQIDDIISTDKLLHSSSGPDASLPITPSRNETYKDGITRKRRSKSPRKVLDIDLKKEENGKSLSKEKHTETLDEECAGNGPAGSDLEYYVKTIRRLECEGHIDKSFRQKFLTWYSIRATPQESRIVKAFVDTLIEDPASLSEQLVDTFGEIISTKRSSDIPHGFCLKLWH